MRYLILASFTALLTTTALAHVTVDPKEAAAGSYTKLVFRIPHGCDGSPTTSIKIKIPSGVTAVKPQVHAGWEITLKKADQAVPKADGKDIEDKIADVTWSGGNLPDEFMDEFGMSVKLPVTPGKTLFFPVEQGCVKGAISWNSETAHHSHDGKGPMAAPSLKLNKGQ